MEILVLALAFGVACAVIANNKGRSAFGWFILGCLFSLLALIVIACLSPLEPQKDNRVPCPNCGKMLEQHLKRCPHCKQMVDLSAPENSGTKICPFCAETIKKDAVVCRYCGRDLPVSEGNEKPEAEMEK